MLERHAWSLLRRLTRWLGQFKDCFGHRAQHVSLRQYVEGLLGDYPRKSMSAMLARVSEPTATFHGGARIAFALNLKARPSRDSGRLDVSCRRRGVRR